MLVIVPNHLSVTDVGILWITGGSNNIKDDGQVDLQDEEVLLISNIAVENGIVAAILFHIPNLEIDRLKSYNECLLVSQLNVVLNCSNMLFNVNAHRAQDINL